MARVYIGNLPPGITERDLEAEFGPFGRIRSLWVARKPPGFAFMEYEDLRDAENAIRRLDGFRGWRVELSRRSITGPNPRGQDRGRSPPRRGRSPSPDRQRRRSPSYDRRRRTPSRSPVRRDRSRSPRDRRRSPERPRSASPPRGSPRDRSPRRSISPGRG